MRFLKRFAACTLFLVLAALSIYLFLPKPTLLDGVPFSHAVYASDGSLMRLTRATDGQYRLFTPINDISPNLIKATLLQEDQHFYQHPAVNPIALIRAAFDTYILKTRRYGGSTITMQLARIRFHIKSNTIKGKLEQIFKAFELERHYRKNQILEAYLNTAAYGGNVSGVGAASLIYFKQPVKNLTLPAALTLSVIPQNPVKRKPETHNQNLIAARNRLFKHWIKTYPQDKKLAYLFKLPFDISNKATLPFIAPQFTNRVISRFSNRGRLFTTLNLQKQKLISDSINNYLQQVRDYDVNNAAAILINNKTMNIEAYVGSSDFFNKKILGQIDGVTASRSPGSALKPFVYALATQQGIIIPKTILLDTPQNISGYHPQDFDDQYLGPITAQQALIMSRNIPAIILEQQLNPRNLYTLLKQVNVPLQSSDHYGLSIVLGGANITMLKLAELYAMFANKGLFQSAHFIQHQPSFNKQPLLSPEASFITLSMLKHNPPPVRSGPLNPKLNVAWKTGTSAGYSDAWAVGDFGHETLVVWLGNFDGSGNPALVGRSMAGPLFFNIAEKLQLQLKMQQTRGLQHKKLNVIKVSVCNSSGKLATPLCPDKSKSWFIPGISPIKKDHIYKLIAIDHKTGLRSCHVSKKTILKTVAFWPSELRKAYASIGILKKAPPAFESTCQFSDDAGIPPHIESPISHVAYDITQNHSIAFRASAAANANTLFWFVNQSLIAKAKPGEAVLWQAKPGHFTVTVVDNQGRSSTTNLDVEES